MGSELGITHETEHELRIDGLAIFYAVLTVVWTIFLASACAFLVAKRNEAVLRIRGVGLSVASVACLHCYWISVQLGYMTGPLMPGDAEYWIMGTWLPLGIALFHASNSRFLHVAEAQRRFMPDRSLHDDDENATATRRTGPLLARLRRMSHTSRSLVFVGAGMVLQIFVTILMYVISRKWHSSWGIPGTAVTGETHMQRKVQMGVGWEWWPTVFWQIFWAWVVAPVILWRSRDIHDTQGWRLQTVACCVANLHAAPMWLIALYVPGMEKVNEYWIPPQWIAVSIMLMEILTILIPCWEVRRHQNLKQETLDSIAQWESKNKFPPGGGARSVASVPTLVESTVTGWKSVDGSVRTTGSNESILTMGALEHVLERNPTPLLEFSALRDFSGENIAFLVGVIEWRTAFGPRTGRRPSSQPDKLADEMVAAAQPLSGEDLARESFNRALRIYVDYISSLDAEFQINLPSPTRKRLESIFEAPARQVLGSGEGGVDPATPFEPRQRQASGSASSDECSEKGIMSGHAAPAAASRAQYWGEIPAAFDHTVFDEAEGSIKYLVLTNTWPKFVKERRSSMDSVASA